VIAALKFVSFMTPNMASKMKKRCQAWHRVVPLMNEQSMPCLASFFDAISGVKNLAKFQAVITDTTSAFEASNAKNIQVLWLFKDAMSGIVL